jgi:diguanylate cyclase (GGDEF)-like protein
LVGVLAYYQKERDAFTADHLRILTNVAPRIGTTIENAIKMKELQEHARVDPTTGLPTLSALMQALDVELIRAKREGQCLAVIVVQFGGLGSQQASAARPELDAGLREAAESLRNGCREYDRVARIGDEKFALILPGMKREAVGPKIEKMNGSLKAVFPRLMKNGSVHLEIGSAFYPDDADTSKMLLTIAEGRNEMHTGGPAESLLALNEHNRREVEEAAMQGRPANINLSR